MHMNIAIYIQFKWISDIFFQRQADVIFSLITVVKQLHNMDPILKA